MGVGVGVGVRVRCGVCDIERLKRRTSEAKNKKRGACMGVSSLRCVSVVLSHTRAPPYYSFRSLSSLSVLSSLFLSCWLSFLRPSLKKERFYVFGDASEKKNILEFTRKDPKPLGRYLSVRWLRLQKKARHDLECPTFVVVAKSKASAGRGRVHGNQGIQNNHQKATIILSLVFIFVFSPLAIVFSFSFVFNIGHQLSRPIFRFPPTVET